MDPVTVIIIDKDDSSRNTLKKIFERSGCKVINDFNNLVAGYNAVIDLSPDIVFVDMSEDIDNSLDIIEKISVHHRSCIIFVASFESNTDLVIKSMRAGAREFLTKPIQPQDLDIALQKSKMLLNSEKKGDITSKIFTVFSNKGGIGKTTIATNLAVSLAKVTGQKVALVDLNLQLGDITTFLDVHPSFDISYVANNINRIDESFLLSTLDKYKDNNLYILADPPFLEQAEEITAEQISSVLNILKSVFSYIIIDTSSNFDSKTISCLDISDNILLVSMINLPSIRNTQRCLDLFTRLDYNSDKVMLIINRYLQSDEISVEDIEEALGHPVYWKIPNNYFAVMSAINRGLPIYKVDSNCNISQNFIELAQSIEGKS
ncbi:MAG: response regulator, partial [Candidatus Gastranaerophilales bacterium]|nr:response regulator [Candidatus Gastranaerophilales bacterium]